MDDVSQLNPMPEDKPVNVALYKPARQSSFSKFSALNDPQGGVDGVRNGKYGFCTALEQDPWWEVDLQGVYAIDRIILYNWLQGAARADNLVVLLSEDREIWRQLPEWTGGRFGGVDGNPAVIEPINVQARFVRVQLQSFNHLHLDEVEVYGRLIEAVEVDYLDLLPEGFSF
jgi:hypothetical protein